MKKKTHNRGQAMITAVFFFLAVSLTVVLGVASPLVRGAAIEHRSERAKASYFLAESLVEDVTYRLKEGMSVDTTEILTEGSSTASSTISTITGGQQVLASSDTNGAIRRVQTQLQVGTGAAFSFGVQTDEGGFLMENSSSINGNLFSNGPIEGKNSSVVRGDVISAGPSGLVDDIHAQGSVYANTIRDSIIDTDAHYQSISSSIVSGTEFPGSTDQATSTLPISDEQITQLEQGFVAVILQPCPFEITEDITLGDIKIACDLEISKDPLITLTGNIWVEGSIEITNVPTIRVASSLGDKSVTIIADDPADRLSGSTIKVDNSARFEGSGSANSFVMLISQNESAEQGGGERAIEVENSVSGDLLVYAPHGEIRVKNDVELKEVAAWRVHLENSVEVTYESGLANLLFTSGPSGGFTVQAWDEVE